MRSILFDKDGTLIDFDATWGPVLRDLALDLTHGDEGAAQAMLVAGGLDPVSGGFRAGSPLAVGTSLDIARLWYPTIDGPTLATMVARFDAFFHEAGIRNLVLLPGVEETLTALAAEAIPMGIATNDGTAGARAALEAVGLDRFFDHIFGYDSVARPKPEPDMVHAFAAATGLAPADVIVVGDNVHDLAMARAAGAGAAIGVLSGNGAAADLAPLADAVLDSVCDLPAWLSARRR